MTSSTADPCATSYQYPADFEQVTQEQVTAAPNPHSSLQGLCLDGSMSEAFGGTPDRATSASTQSTTVRQPQTQSHLHERPQAAPPTSHPHTNQSRNNVAAASPHVDSARPRLATPHVSTSASSTALSMLSPRPTCRADPFSPTPRATVTSASSTPSTPAGHRHPSLAPSVVRATPLRDSPRSSLVQLPSTPRAVPSRALPHSISTPGRPRPVVQSTPLRLYTPSFTSAGSTPGSRVGTPSPFSRSPTGNTSVPASHSNNPFFSAGSAPVSHNISPLRTGAVPSPSPDASNRFLGVNLDTLSVTTPGVEIGSTPGTPNEGTSSELASGSQGSIMESPRLHRVRTPPPLAQQYNRVVVSNEDIEESDGFITQPAELRNEPLRVELIPVATTKAPTVAEFVIAKAKEIRQIQGGRKSKEQIQDGASTSNDRTGMGVFSKPHQGFMKVMRAHLLWDYITRSPWSEDKDGIISRAKTFASTATGMPGDTICTEPFNLTVSD